MGDLNINFNPPGRLSDPPTISKGRRGIPGWLWFLVASAVAIVGVVVIVAMVSETEPPPADARAGVPAKLKGDAEAVEVAKLFEGLLKSTSPAAADYIDTVDVSGPQGHLIVYTRQAYAGLDHEDKRVIETNIAVLWREAKWVKDRSWDPRVEFMEPRPEGGYAHHFAD